MNDVHREENMTAGEPAAPASVGESLRRAREARRETVGDVAYALKLTTRQVEAMEAERFDLLPGPAFVRGFLRNYGRYLGLDPAALLAGLAKNAAAMPVELAPLSNAEGVMPSGRATRSARLPAALVAGALLTVVVAGWFFDWFQMPDTDPSAVELAPSEGEATPLSVPLEPPPPAEPEVAPQLSSPAAVAPDGVATNDVPPPAPVAAPLPEAAPASVPEDSAATNVPAALPGVEHLVFRFAGESWVEVRDASGTIIFSGLNAAGSTRTIQGEPPFRLVVGNAPKVTAEFRGQPLDLVPHIRVGVAKLTVK
ncbi:helix-turn-helix domain-containing protein [Azoarcus sp. PA01]|nr:helix-turn-helix domain-containing protein [Azoarcus sp. PA01]